VPRHDGVLRVSYFCGAFIVDAIDMLKGLMVSVDSINLALTALMIASAVQLFCVLSLMKK